MEKSDSYLAQGGMCVLREPSDYESYYEDCEWCDFTDEENDKIATALANELVKGTEAFLPMEGTPLSSSNLKWK